MAGEFLAIPGLGSGGGGLAEYLTAGQTAGWRSYRNGAISSVPHVNTVRGQVTFASGIWIVVSAHVEMVRDVAAGAAGYMINSVYCRADLDAYLGVRLFDIALGAHAYLAGNPMWVINSADAASNSIEERTQDTSVGGSVNYAYSWAVMRLE